MGNKKDFLTDTFLYGLGSGVRKFIGIFLLPFYTRALTPGDYGVLSSMATFAMLFSAFIDIGLDSATSYYYLTSKDEKEKGQILFTLLVLRLLTFVPSIILSFFSHQISLLLFGSGSYTWIVFLTCITIPFSFLLSEQTYVYRYLRKPMNYNYVTVIQSIMSIGLGISLVVVLKYGVIGAQLSSLISTAFILPFTFLMFTRKQYIFKFSLYWAKKLIKFGYPLIGAAIATWVFQSSDRFFLLHYSNLTEIGWYSIGQTFSQPLLLLNTAVQMSFGVLFLRTYNEDTTLEKTNSKKMAISSFNLYLVAGISISLVLSIFSIELLKIITTKDYLKGALAIPFLCFSSICSQAYQTMGMGITLAEKTYYYTWITVMTAVINIILNILFIPTMGFVGAALATLISFVIYWIIKVYYDQKFFPIAYPFSKVFIYFFVSLVVSLFVPISFFYFNIKITFVLKALILVLGLLFPFILKLIEFSAIKSVLISVRNRF
jgi:O-antigen/teichoic acid export membrane protein